MLNINSKQWIRLRVNTTKKTLTATNEIKFNSKSECDKTVKSNQYISVNLKAYNRLLSEGYVLVSDNNKVAVSEVVVSTVKEEWTPQYLVGDPVLEETIRQYVVAKKTRQEANQQAIARFLTPVPQPKNQISVSVQKRVDKYYSKDAQKNAIYKQEQILDYCRN